MIVITGAAGFIGSRMVKHLNESGRSDLVLVDNFPVTPVETCQGVTLQGECESLREFRYLEKIPRDLFFDWASQNCQHISFIIHLGAETSVTNFDETLLVHYNLEFSQRLWSLAAMNRIPLLFAASSNYNTIKWYVNGATTEKKHGMAAEIRCEELKCRFDHWVLKQRVTPPLWAGFVLPEVYGFREQHKGLMASSVFHSLQQIMHRGKVVVPVFSQTESCEEPLADRIFVKDVVTIFTWFFNHIPASGFYALTTGYPRPLSAVAKALFSFLKKEPDIEFLTLPFPDKMSRYGENMLPLNKLRRVGYKKSFTPLERGLHFYMNDLLKNTDMLKLLC